MKQFGVTSGVTRRPVSLVATNDADEISCVRFQLRDTLLMTLRIERHCRNSRNGNDQHPIQMVRSQQQALLRRVSFPRRWQVLRQSPRIAVLLQTMNDIISNAVAFFFGQLLAKSAHQFACAS
jgi:hypothetical protein